MPETRVPGQRAPSGYYRILGAAAGSPRKGYYSFDLGGWHLIALNSNCSEIGGCSAGSRQERWLRADLAAHASAACTLAYWHHPPVLLRRARERLHVRGILAGALRRQCRSRARRARPRLRALCPADSAWRSRSGARDPRVRRRLGGQEPADVPRMFVDETRHATSRSASSSSRFARRATAGASGRPSGPSQIRATAPATDRSSTGDSRGLTPKPLRLLTYRFENDEPRSLHVTEQSDKAAVPSPPEAKEQLEKRCSRSGA